ncbi:MAG: ice-binding family protein [Balneolaceae bacterium]
MNIFYLLKFKNELIMIKHNQFFKYIVLTTLIFTGIYAQSNAQERTNTDNVDSTLFDKQNVNIEMNNNENKESSTDTLKNSKVNMIDLGKAGQFVILAKTNISKKSESRITGQTGEGSVADSMNNQNEDSDTDRQQITNQFVILPSNQSDSTSLDVSEAIEDMMSAYEDASMQNGDHQTSHHDDSFNDSLLTAGVHEWSDSLHIVSDVTLSGSETDLWLFKVSGNLTVDEDVEFTLADGARADNVFWYVEGEVTVGENAQFEGIILSRDEITLEKGAQLKGRMFSQTSIALDDNTVSEPELMDGQASSTNR